MAGAAPWISQDSCVGFKRCWRCLEFIVLSLMCYALSPWIHGARSHARHHVCRVGTVICCRGWGTCTSVHIIQTRQLRLHCMNSKSCEHTWVFGHHLCWRSTL
jgi:hypothetical protein